MFENEFKIPESVQKPVEINIAPLIDMVFILLIFFIVTSSFTRETGIDVHKPVAATAKILDQQNIQIGITREGTIHIHDRQVDLPLLFYILKRLMAENPERAVIIIADRDVSAGIVVDVMDECNRAGVKKSSIAAMRER